MRTTVELPQELMREAKIRAAAHGESLKSLLTRALATELGRSSKLPDGREQVRLPLFGNPRKKPVDVTREDIAHALAEEDGVRVKRPKHPGKR